jgi:hypothetical protein
MATVPHEEVRVTIGVDTHEDVHVAVALDQLGRRLGELPIPTHTGGYAQLVDWASEFGVIDQFGVEGTGSWGAGLSRWLRAEGLVVIEVDRPDRKTRRHGKSDTIDAAAAARAVLSGKATTGPKTGDGPVEMIRVLRLTRRSAVKNRTMTANQINALITTAPHALRDQLRCSPDEAVAHGAALHAGILLAKSEGQSPQFNIRNVNSHSLGLVATDTRTRRPRTAILIPRNTPLPVTVKRVFKTHKAGQKSIKVQIVEGESPSPDDCVPLGKCSIRDLPANLPARTPIEVGFHYEENGRLDVQVRVPGTGKHLQHQITRENSLNRDQLDSWRKHVSGLPPLAGDVSKTA